MFFTTITWRITRICLTAAVAARRGALLTFTPFQILSVLLVCGLRVKWDIGRTSARWQRFPAFRKKTVWLASLTRDVESKPCTFDASWRLCRHVKPPSPSCPRRYHHLNFIHTSATLSLRLGVRQVSFEMSPFVDPGVCGDNKNNQLSPLQLNLARVMLSFILSFGMNKASFVTASCLSPVFPSVRRSYWCIWRSRSAPFSTS